MVLPNKKYSCPTLRYHRICTATETCKGLQANQGSTQKELLFGTIWLHCKQFGLHTHGLQLACCRVPEASAGCASALPGGMRVVIWTLFGGSPGFNTP